ncbi:TPA: PTS sugar transporter subunit IIA [Enterococcus faecium]
MEFKITSHGNIAIGFVDTLKMFFGDNLNCHVVTLGDAGIEEFRENIEKIVSQVKNQEVMVFADLIGGTPFNEFAKRSEVFQNGFQLLGGMNLGILIEAVNLRLQGKKSDDIIENLRNMNTIACLADMQRHTNEEDE